MSAAPLLPAAARDLAQAMLLGQHSVTYTADHTRLPIARVEEMARKLLAAKRIPRLRP